METASMDDVQPRPEARGPPPKATAADQDKDAMPFDGLEQLKQDPPAMQTEDATGIRVPTAKIEVVIEKKAVLEPEDPIFPDHYYDNGKIPVFKPTMDQFRNFEKFITRINDYGMQAGIVKVIPPPEWREALPPLDEQVKSIKLRNAIEQQFAGTAGVFRQMNIEKRRVYNLPQWRALCESTDHQPPAKRGEVRMAGHTVSKRKAQPKQKGRPSPKKPKLDTPASGNPSAPAEAWVPFTNPQSAENNPPLAKKCINCSADVEEPAFVNPTTDDVLCRTCGIPDNYVATINPDGPNDNATLTTPQPQPPQFLSPEPSSTEDAHPQPPLDRSTSPEQNLEERQEADLGRATTPLSPPELKKRKRRGTSVDAAEADDVRDADDFRRFDYRIGNAGEYTVERCRELERIYWKTLTFNNPLYGADMPGSLFDDQTDVWNVAKLDNLLCRIDKLIPGVNSAYLYLGMWKATFSWHVEDMDLYSINYIHFGAPKQWYSISQCDAEKFESFMRSHFPNDHKGCPQFMRHKTFLASPSALDAKGINVNRLVHHEGEFVITFPFGYHSGYNLGYNCAESVNFATDEWLDIGRNARKCNCVGDSVNINVDDILDALRGPVEQEYEDVFTPPDCTDGMVEAAKKPKRERKVKTEPKVIIKIKRFPCMLCPNSIVGEPLLPAGADRFVHRICAQYIPETYITANEDGSEIVSGIDKISPARWNLKCLYCSSTRGAKFQCSATSCCRAYHATCATAAGVLVETAEDEFGFVSSYQCRFHRPKRPGVLYLEQDQSIAEYASKLKPNDTIQGRLASADNDVPFVGTVTENCRSEETVSIELATGEIFEVAYKWILAPPKRDVRALCATQSVPGSTKKRQKKKPKVGNQSAPDATSLSENAAPSGIFTNVSVTSTPTTAPEPVPWSVKNPGFTQHHEFVWNSQTLGSSSTETLTADVRQRLQSRPPQPHIPEQPRHLPTIAPRHPEVRVPASLRFNLPLPPPLLPHPALREVPIFPRPSMENHRDVSAGILFVHSDLGRDQAWRDQYAAQFYRSSVAITASQTRPLPQLLPRPPVASPTPQPIPQGAQPCFRHRNENTYPDQGQA